MRAEGEESVSEECHRATWAAFDRWSHVCRHHPLMPERNENRKIAVMLDTLAQEAPIARTDGTLVGRHLLAAQAADFAKTTGKEFKAVEYACTTVKNLLGEWAAKGIPGDKPKNGHHAKPTARPRESFRGTRANGMI